MLSLPDIRQRDTSDCGAAAVMSVCRFHGVGPTNYDDYITALGTDHSGTSPESILSFLSTLGLLVSPASPLGIADLAWWLARSRPVLCPIQSGGTGHWVVVVDVFRGLVIYHDPSRGLREARGSVWLADWMDTDRNGVVYERYGIAVGRAHS